MKWAGIARALPGTDMKKLVLLLAIVFVDGAGAAELCPSDAFALRTATPACWVRYALRGGSGEDALCISRDLWRELLREGKLHGRAPAPCARWEGRWRVFSPPQNGGPRNNARQGGKIHIKRFYASKMSDPRLAADFFRRAWDKTRSNVERAREAVSGFLAPRDPHGLVRRLLLDERLPDSPVKLLRTIGFVHLVTAAGIHLYSLAMVAREAALALAGLFGMPAGRAARCAKLFAVMAWLLSGMRPGMLRPVIVVGLRLVARMAGARWRLLAPLAIALAADGAAALVTGWAPGRLHYALAVGGALLAHELVAERLGRRRMNPVLRVLSEHLALSVGSWLFTAVWDAFDAGLVATATPLISLVTLPVISGVIYPALFISVATSWSALCGAACLVLERLVDVMLLVSTAADSLWVVPRWAVLSALALAGAVFAAGAHARRVLYVLVPVIIIFRLFNYYGVDAAGARRWLAPASSVEQLDVGQGDAALVRSGDGGGWGLVDTGPARALGRDGWLRLLAARGARGLDWVVLTHLDEDHAGGAGPLGVVAGVGCFRGGAIARRDCFPFASRRLGRGAGKGPNADMNAFVVPLRGGGIYVSMGDASARDELGAAEWIREQGRGGRIVLKASHHGSRYSTDKRLLALLRPAVVFVSSGVGNAYGHPSVWMIERLEKARIPYRRTDIMGGLIAK